LERVAPQALDELRAAGDDPRLRPAEELVAAEADEVGAGREGGLSGRLSAYAGEREVDERSGTEVVHKRHAYRRGRRGELTHGGLLREPHDAEVRLVDTQHEGGLGPRRLRVVLGARRVRRPDR